MNTNVPRARTRRQEQVERFLRAGAVAEVQFAARAPRAPRPRPAGSTRASADGRERRRGCCSRARRTPACKRAPRRRFAATLTRFRARSTAKRSEAVDAAVETVARHDGADTRGRSRENEVAGQQLVVLRQEVHGVRDVPDHVGEIALLPALAVDVEPDRAARSDARSRTPDGSAPIGAAWRTTCRCPTAASSRASRSAGRGASCRARPRSPRPARAHPPARASRRARRSRRPARSRGGSSSSRAGSGCARPRAARPARRRRPAW